MTTLRTLIDIFISGIRALSIEELAGTGPDTRITYKLPSGPPYGVMRSLDARSAFPDKLKVNSAYGKKKTARLARRSPEDITRDLARVIGALAKGPINAETLRVTLDLSAKELPRILHEGLRTKALRKTGQKRATVYSLGGAPAAKKATPKTKKVKPAAKKTAPKAKKGASKAKKVAPKVKKPASKTKKVTPKAKTPTPPASVPKVAASA